MKYDNPRLRQILAGEYALGALHGAAKARFETLMRRDPLLRRAVNEWREDLTPLANETRSATPPRRVFASIARRLEPGTAPGASLWERLGFWRAIAAGGMAAVVVLALVTTFLSLSSRPALPPSYVAVLEDESARPALVVTAYKDPWRVTIAPLALAALPPDRVLQVWAIEKESGAVRPLLAFTPGQSRHLALTETNWKLVKSAYTLAVSVEAAGSNPSAPTTPVLYSGLCINLTGV